MSMVSAMHEAGANKLGGMVKNVRLLYSARPEKKPETGEEEDVLFASRLAGIADHWKDHKDVDFRYTQFNTGKGAREPIHNSKDVGSGVQPTKCRRIHQQDLAEALGPVGHRDNVVVFVCGLPSMTDGFVEWFKQAPGMDERRVLCEKWW